MAIAADLQNVPDEFMLLMRDDRSYSSPPTWTVRVSPRCASIRPRSLWKLGIVHAAIFALLGAALRWGGKWFNLSDDVVRFGAIGAWFAWAMGAACLVGVFLFEKCRCQKAWFIFRIGRPEVICPRLNTVLPLNDIHAMQLITGWVKEQWPGEISMRYVAQLNLIVRESDQLHRYALVGDRGPGRLSRDAEFLSQFCGVPLLRYKTSSTADWTSSPPRTTDN